MTLNEALAKSLHDVGVLCHPNSCLWTAEADAETVWVYLESADKRIHSHRVKLSDLKRHLNAPAPPKR